MAIILTDAGHRRLDTNAENGVTDASVWGILGRWVPVQVSLRSLS
jgi:hypothetical protein